MTQQNSRCKLHDDWDETINPILSECSKLLQKEYKTTLDWVRKVIYRELCKFVQTYKSHMYNPESVLETEIHKIL